MSPPGTDVAKARKNQQSRVAGLSDGMAPGRQKGPQAKECRGLLKLEKLRKQILSWSL